jgi:ABC-type branched-subunit amino acid transport system substrate-binding protein
MNMRKRLGIIVGLAAVLAAVAVLFVRISNVKPGGRSDRDLRVFHAVAILPLTGNTAVIGQEERDGMMLALEDLGTAQFRLNLRVEDFAGDPRLAISAFRKALGTNNLVAIFASTSQAVNPLLPLLAENQGFLFFPITTQKGVIVSRNVFRVWPTITQEAALLLSYLSRYPDRPVVLMYPTNELGTDLRNELRAGLGRRLVLELPHPLTATDLTADLLRIRALPNLRGTILVAWAYPAQTLLILKRMDELQIHPHSLLTSLGTDFPPVLAYLSASDRQPIFAAPEFEVTERKRAFTERFRRRFGYPATWNVAAAYDNLTFLIRALQACWERPGSQLNSCLFAVSRNLAFEGVSGPVRMPDHNEADFPLILATFDRSKGLVRYE